MDATLQATPNVIYKVTLQIQRAELMVSHSSHSGQRRQNGSHVGVLHSQSLKFRIQNSKTRRQQACLERGMISLSSSFPASNFSEYEK